jgi:hypothetical protein
MSASTPMLGTILASFFNDHLKLQSLPSQWFVT